FFNPLVLFITFEYISPHFFTKFIAYKVAHSNMSLENAQKYFSLSNYIYINTFATLSNGIVIGAMVSFILKSKKE
ncbi:MAG TPA: DUF4199 domain-containing protein, partial [Flavobacterium sp.]|nr:DUF4199 domain-containing protein [Flavobacterium sp.]